MDKNDISVEVVATKILVIRGKKVILDKDLALLYGVPVKRLSEQVKRNLDRFPEDFMFQLTKDETVALRSQIATLNDHPETKEVMNSRRGKHIKYLPCVFTEQGVAMLSSVLNSKRAIQVNIAIMRAFVQLRLVLLTHKELAEKLEELERKYQLHESDIQLIFETIKKLLEPPPEPPKPRFGLN